MRLVGLRVFLMVAVLVQYTPLRVCALEQIAVGVSCHDGEGHDGIPPARGGALGGHEQGDGEHECICERPKVDAQNSSVAGKSAIDWTCLSIAVAGPGAGKLTQFTLPQDSDPPLHAMRARQFPLLI